MIGETVTVAFSPQEPHIYKVDALRWWIWVSSQECSERSGRSSTDDSYLRLNIRAVLEGTALASNITL